MVMYDYCLKFGIKDKYFKAIISLLSPFNET